MQIALISSMNKKVVLRSLFFPFIGLVLAASGPDASTISELKMLDVYVVSNDLKFDGTQVGGLSGIDYDVENDIYYAICDDRSERQAARYYKVKIAIANSQIDSIIFQEKVDFIGQDGKTYPSMKADPKHTIDPEGLRYNPKTQEMIWVSEGERIVREKDTLLVDPTITTAKAGKYIGQYPIHSSATMHAGQMGPRQNGAFEGLTFTDDYKNLLVALEEPLYQDGPRADVEDSKSLIRIYSYDVATGKNIAQYAYDLESVAYAPILTTAFRVNGITDILDGGQNQLLVMERSFSTGRLPCTVKVFLCDLNSASNVMALASLKDQKIKLLSKKLVLNMDDLGIHIDNVEGMTWGPVLPNGHKTLIFVSDNNFQSFQRTQVFLFEVIP